MSNEVTVLSANALPTVVIPSLEEFREVAQSSSFLQRIQLYSKGRYVETGLISPGHFGVPVSEDEIEDLGTEIDLLVISLRLKAIDMSDKDAISVTYDSTSPEYSRIRDAADTTKDSHCMYGPTFLVFERGSGRSYEMFFGNKSMRREATKLYGFLPLSPEKAAELSAKTGKTIEPHGPQTCTLKAKYVTAKGYGWHVPVCYPCSTPFDNLPSIEAMSDELLKFHAIKGDEVEKVEEPAGKRRAR